MANVFVLKSYPCIILTLLCLEVSKAVLIHSESHQIKNFRNAYCRDAFVLPCAKNFLPSEADGQQLWMGLVSPRVHQGEQLSLLQSGLGDPPKFAGVQCTSGGQSASVRPSPKRLHHPNRQRCQALSMS